MELREFDEKDSRKIIGRISYPCHPKKSVVVFDGTKGEVSSACPVCGAFIRFNFDTMESRKARMIRGASQII